MIIDTKFRIGDKCYILHENRVQCWYVQSMLIEVDCLLPKLSSLVFWLYSTPEASHQNIHRWVQKEGNECFKTKEELLKSL